MPQNAVYFLSDGFWASKYHAKVQLFFYMCKNYSIKRTLIKKREMSQHTIKSNQRNY